MKFIEQGILRILKVGNDVGELSNSTTSASTDSNSILSANSNRTYLSLSNASTSVPIWLNFSTEVASVGTGMLLNPETTITFDKNSIYKGNVNAVVGAGTATIGKVEGNYST